MTMLGSVLLPMFATGASVNPWTGATWAVDGNGRAYNTPTLGAELISNGNMETWTSATDLSSWTENLTGTSTVNRESSVVDSGAYALRLDVDSSGSSVYVIQAVSGLVVGTWYAAQVRAKASVAGKDVYMRGAANASVNQALTTFYALYALHERAPATTTNAFFARGAGLAPSSSLYCDNYTLKAITLSSAIAVINAATPNVVASCTINAMTTGTKAGAVALLDSATSPANFIVSYHDGGASIKMDKCVGGIYTNLVTATTGFASDAKCEVRPIGSNQFDCYYNGSKRGSTATVADAGIVSNTIYGMFSTYSGNTFSEFTLDNVVIPFVLPGV